MHDTLPASISSCCCIVTAALLRCLGCQAMDWVPVVQGSSKSWTKEFTIHLRSLLQANVNGRAPGSGFFLGIVLCPKKENCTSSANAVIQFPVQLYYRITASEWIFYNEHEQRAVCSCLPQRWPGLWCKKQHRVAGRQGSKGGDNSGSAAVSDSGLNTAWYFVVCRWILYSFSSLHLAYCMSGTQG